MTRQRAARAWWVVVSCCLLPGLVLSSVWLPLISRYYAPGAAIPDQILEASRRSPSDAALEELGRMRFFPGEGQETKRVIEDAEKILRGEGVSPRRPSARFTMPFDPRDLEEGPQGLQLKLASFDFPDALLDAYKATGRDDFFFAARDIILAWAAYERSAWLPRGFLWNDHAVAARVMVLSEFWRLYRHRPDYRPEAARAVLELAVRSGQLLAKPGLFNVSTNHGVMQNLALWHLCAAFPSLPDREHYKQVALARLRVQMAFYVNDEGVVLEHSAEYHAVGLHMLSMAFRYMALLGEPVPADWQQKYDRAKKFYTELRRPDGTLPMFGDTDGAPLWRALSPTGDATGFAIPHEAASLYPTAGYAIWWDGLQAWPDARKLQQTVVAWSHFPGLGHKHADEMSILFWAAGQAWWTNTGYWPYDQTGRKQAESWSGSDAPHLVGEARASDRKTRLLSWGLGSKMAGLDLQRTGPGAYVVRRQVLRLKPNLWVVVDSTSGDADTRTTTTWTTADDVALAPGATPGSYRLRAEKNGPVLTAFVFGSPGMSVKEFRGSLSPFAGWKVVHVVPRPAPAIVTEQPANGSWSVALWSLDDGAESPAPLANPPQMTRWESAQDWQIALPLRSETLYLTREGDVVSFGRGRQSGEAETFMLSKAADAAAAADSIIRAHGDALVHYPQFKDLVIYRKRISYLLIWIVVVQEIFFAIYRRVAGQRYIALRIASMICWLGLGVWVCCVYLRT